MFKKTVSTREELHKVLDALDLLGKPYAVNKEISEVDNGLAKYSRVRWTIEEVEQTNRSVTVSNLKVKLEADTSSFESSIERVKKQLESISRYVTKGI